MKFQISRYSHNPSRRYSGVYQQQGRVITDDDWNLLQAIINQRLDMALRNVLGSGVPLANGIAVSPQLEVTPGHVYASGVGGTVEGSFLGSGYGSQNDFPEVPGVPAAGEFLYVDVWDREVLFLEDPALRDEGLNGADTCARLQAVVQIKRAPGDVDPGNDPRNPSLGSGALTLTFRSARAGEGGAGQDACDLEATEVASDQPSDNFLFRFEVHDVRGPANAPTALTLKWSSENAAEVYAVGAEPGDFLRGEHSYEYYDTTSEQHLGVHLVAAEGFPRRGAIRDGTAGAGEGRFVRRWDGHCTLTRAPEQAWRGATVAIEGRDLGTAVLTSTPRGQIGHAEVTDGVLHLNLQAFDVDLEIAERSFIAGDYWLATVRGTDRPGAQVIKDATPIGIIHHYAKLGRVEASEGGTTFVPEPVARVPSLSDLASMVGAQHVGAAGVGGDPKTLRAGTVSDQLAALLAFLNEHIRTPANAHAANAISAVSDPALPGTTTVQGQLSALVQQVQGVRREYLRRLDPRANVFDRGTSLPVYEDVVAPALVTVSYRRLDGAGHPTGDTLASGGAFHPNIQVALAKAAAKTTVVVTNGSPEPLLIIVDLYVGGDVTKQGKEDKDGAKEGSKDNKEQKEAKEKEDKERKEGKEAKEKEDKDSKEHKEQAEQKASKESKEQKEAKEKEDKERKEQKEKEDKDGKDGKEQKEAKEQSKEGRKDGKEQKDGKERKDGKEKEIVKERKDDQKDIEDPRGRPERDPFKHLDMPVGGSSVSEAQASEAVVPPVGRAFIRPDERPPVGDRLVKEGR